MKQFSTFKRTGLQQIKMLKWNILSKHASLTFILLTFSSCWFRAVLQMRRWSALPMGMRKEAKSRVQQTLTRWRKDVVSF